MNPPSLKLVEIYDTDADHEVGGQDLPYLVTASYDGDYQPVADFISNESSLVAFNVRPAISRRSLPAHVEFCTFESRDIICRFFNVPRSPSPLDGCNKRDFFCNSFYRTECFGEVRTNFLSSCGVRLLLLRLQSGRLAAYLHATVEDGNRIKQRLTLLFIKHAFADGGSNHASSTLQCGCHARLVGCVAKCRIGDILCFFHLQEGAI